MFLKTKNRNMKIKRAITNLVENKKLFCTGIPVTKLLRA